MCHSNLQPPVTQYKQPKRNPRSHPQEAHQQASYTERVLSEAQRSQMGLSQVNAWLQEELDACRAARRQQEAAAAEAAQRAAVAEVRFWGPAII